MGVLAYVSVRLYFYSSTSLFTKTEVRLTSIWDSPVCAFPPLFVLAGLCNQEHFCIPKMGFGVEGTFHRFFMTLTLMFFLHIKLLGGPLDCFFPNHLEEKCGPGDNHAQMSGFVFSNTPHSRRCRTEVRHWVLRALYSLLKVGGCSPLRSLHPPLRGRCLVRSYSGWRKPWHHTAMMKSEIRCHHSGNHKIAYKTRLWISVSENRVVLPLFFHTGACFFKISGSDVVQ